MSRTSATLFATAVLILLLALPSGARAAGDEGDEMTARTHFAAGEYKQALDIYARLYAETMHPTYLRNIARCQQNLGDADRAITSFREYLRKAKDLSAAQRAEVEGYIAEMEQMKRSQAPSPPPLPPPAPTPPALVDPPTVVAERSRDDEAGPFYTRFWFWTVVAGAAVAGIASVWLLSRDSGATHGNLGALDLRDKGR